MQPAALYHSAFYQFADIADVDAAVQELRRLTTALNGSVLVAAEGINGAVAGEAPALDAFEAALLASPVFNGQLQGMAFKRSACTTAPFARMKVHHKPEIVAVGVPAQPVPAGSSLGPQAWRELIARDDVVVLDNRNSFEFRLGRFKGAIDPQVANFRDFPKFIEANAPQWLAEGKRVAMYCTGGIRCEKTAAWMHDAFDLDVHQLEGGILRYLAETPEPQLDWQGECFVFDNRIALDAQLNETTTTAADVYAGDADETWRLQRAQRLAGP